MKSTKVIILFMLLLMPLFASSDTNSNLAVDIETDSTDVYFRTDDLVFRIPTTKIPQYFFWLNQPLATTYKVQFDLMFEVFDVNNDSMFTEGIDIIIPGSFQSLPQLGWAMSEIIEEETPDYTITSFNLTGSEEGAMNPYIDDLVVQFNNHIMNNGTNTELKFDVLINNYVWTNSSDSTMLVLAFKLDGSALFFADYQLVNQEGYQFFFDWGANFLSNNITITISSPIGVIISQNKGEYNIFPSNIIFSSDGERIIIEWKGLSNAEGLNTLVFVQYFKEARVVKDDNY